MTTESTAPRALPKKKPAFGKAFLIQMLVGAAFGAGFVLLALAVLGTDALKAGDGDWRPHVLDFLLGLPLSIFVSIVWHELGHLAFGLARGMRFLLFIAGPLKVARTSTGLRTSFVTRLGAIGGVAATLPDPSRPVRGQLATAIAGGPIASLVLGGLAFAAIVPLEQRAEFHALLLGAVSTFFGVVNLVPFRAGGMMTDGMQLIDLARGGVSTEQRTLLVGLHAQSVDGIRPRDLDAELVDRAIALVPGLKLADIATWFYAYLRALDENRIDVAATWLDRIEADFAAYPDGFRQGLAIELAYFEATHRGHVARANEWLAEHAQGGIVDLARRRLAEAAIAHASGRVDDALRLAKEARAALARTTDAGVSRLTADQIDALEAALAAAARDEVLKATAG